MEKRERVEQVKDGLERVVRVGDSVEQVGDENQEVEESVNGKESREEIIVEINGKEIDLFDLLENDKLVGIQVESRDPISRVLYESPLFFIVYELKAKFGIVNDVTVMIPALNLSINENVPQIKHITIQEIHEFHKCLNIEKIVLKIHVHDSNLKTRLNYLYSLTMEEGGVENPIILDDSCDQSVIEMGAELQVQDSSGENGTELEIQDNSGENSIQIMDNAQLETQDNTRLSNTKTRLEKNSLLNDNMERKRKRIEETIEIDDLVQ